MKNMNDIGLLVFRVSVGLLMLIAHGWPKFMKLLEGGEIKFFDPFGVGPFVSLLLAVLAELFASLLITLGLFTRLSSVSLIVTMFVAAFLYHADDPFSRQEKAILFLISYVLLFFTGPGKFSLQTIVEKRSAKFKKFLLG